MEKFPIPRLSLYYDTNGITRSRDTNNQRDAVPKPAKAVNRARELVLGVFRGNVSSGIHKHVWQLMLV